MFSRVLVANRGEVAVRVIRAVHELGAEAVAVYSTADEDALHVRMADAAVCIGPPPAAESYLRIPNVVAAAATTGCEAVHPGFGFLSENPAFVRACEDNSLVFVGPPAEVMERVGDKAQREGGDASGRRAARSRAATASARSTSCVPWQRRSASRCSSRRARAEGARGCGSCSRPTSSSRPSPLPSPRPRRPSATARSTSSARSCRRGTSRSRCSATQSGGVLTMGERECSIQRRHQKLIEESPSPALTPETREAMEASVERACRRLGYVNAGTFEFLVGPEGEPSFIEVNCRLQVEHPVTELTTGIDIVRTQLAVAAGEPLPTVGARPAIGARDRDPHQRRGSLARVRAGAGARHALPPSARPRRARRHGDRRRHSRSPRTTTR